MFREDTNQGGGIQQLNIDMEIFINIFFPTLIGLFIVIFCYLGHLYIKALKIDNFEKYKFLDAGGRLNSYRFPIFLDENDFKSLESKKIKEKK
jgi:hypothetical protein